MRRVLIVVACVLGAGHALAAPCDGQSLDRLTTDAMSAAEESRLEGYGALKACHKLAIVQFRTDKSVDEDVLRYIATLSGRLAAASYAVNEEPPTSPIVATLMRVQFDQFYHYVRQQPEAENSALMRSLVLHMAEPMTGSIKKDLD